MLHIPFRAFRTPASALALLVANTRPVFAQVVSTVQANPAGSGPINAALGWIEGTLLGSVATTAAVIAVAVVGLMMLTGRIDWRRGLTVILGAFILFGAATIVAGIKGAAGGTP